MELHKVAHTTRKPCLPFESIVSSLTMLYSNVDSSTNTASLFFCGTYNVLAQFFERLQKVAHTTSKCCLPFKSIVFFCSLTMLSLYCRQSARCSSFVLSWNMQCAGSILPSGCGKRHIPPVCVVFLLRRYVFIFFHSPYFHFTAENPLGEVSLLLCGTWDMVVQYSRTIAESGAYQ